MDFLKKRRGQLEGVVITGGEPLYQPGIADFIKSIKSLNYSVKVDTNGSFPEKLAGIIDAGLLDYVAMDIKAPLKDYRKIIRVEVNLERIRQSITLLINSGIDIEFRITLAEEICSLDSMESMASLIQGAGIVYLQKCNFKNATEKSRAELDQYMEVFTQRGIKCYFR
jgi:pyruvate formate lyase activating enzyme